MDLVACANAFLCFVTCCLGNRIRKPLVLLRRSVCVVGMQGTVDGQTEGRGDGDTGRWHCRMYILLVDFEWSFYDVGYSCME